MTGSASSLSASVTEGTSAAGVTPAGLPARRPAPADVTEAELLAAFTRSWEPSDGGVDPAAGRLGTHKSTDETTTLPGRTPLGAGSLPSRDPSLSRDPIAAIDQSSFAGFAAAGEPDDETPIEDPADSPIRSSPRISAFIRATSQARAEESAAAPTTPGDAVPPADPYPGGLSTTPATINPVTPATSEPGWRPADAGGTLAARFAEYPGGVSASEPVSPPEPVKPPEPVTPPEPATPPKPAAPPEPAGPPAPPAPSEPPRPGPPSPAEPPSPRPLEPPSPLEPPEPKPFVPPAPPRPEPGPAPVPVPTPPPPVPPTPNPPKPVPPQPVPPGPVPPSPVPPDPVPAPPGPTPPLPLPGPDSVPPIQPGPAVPTPGPSPLPTPPRMTGATSASGVYQGGRYGQTASPGRAATTPAAGAAVPPLAHPVASPRSVSGSAAVPPVVRQRAGGTVYGGQTGLPTTSNSESPLEMSGSLTGMILSRGRSEAQLQALRKKERRSRWRTGILITIGTLIFFGLLGLVAAVLAGGFIEGLIKAVTK